MAWPQLLTEVRNAYRNAPNKKQTINPSTYLVMLNAFGTLLPAATNASAFIIDWRRNLPGGCVSGIQVLSLANCLRHVAKLAETSPLQPNAGEGIAENLLTIVDLVSPTTAHDVLVPHREIFLDIVAGNL